LNFSWYTNKVPGYQILIDSQKEEVLCGG